MDYKENEIVAVTLGGEGSVRKKLFTAMIDKVFVKPMEHVTARECQGESAALKKISDLQSFLKSICGKDIMETDLVTVLYFSEIISD